MRVFFVYPGHTTSTYDVAKYLHAAMERVDGVEIRPYPLHTEIAFNRLAIQSFYEKIGKDKEPAEQDYMYLAARSMASEILLFRPDVVLFINGLAISPIVWEHLIQVRREVRHPWVQAIYLTEGPYMPNDELSLAANYADVAFTNEREFVRHLRGLGVPGFYLPHAYSPDVHYPRTNGEEVALDVYLCGTGYRERTKLLESVDWSGIRLAIRGIWPGIPGTSLEPYYREGVIPNQDVAEAYRHSHIAINIHRTSGSRIATALHNGAVIRREAMAIDNGDAYSTNARVIEAAACGCIVATDFRQDVYETLGDAALYFHDAASLEEGIRSILEDDERRARMSAVAIDRISGRTYDRNARYILDTIRRL